MWAGTQFKYKIMELKHQETLWEIEKIERKSGIASNICLHQ